MGGRADVGSTIVLVHHSSHEGNETHYVVDYYVVVNNMWAGGRKREEGRGKEEGRTVHVSDKDC